MSDEKQFSPMMMQYWNKKQEYNDCILMYRLGDFYEMFFDDAVLVSKILGLTLTSRNDGKGGKAPMCGIPVHASETYINKLVASGNKVAICEQLSEVQKGKKLVDRFDAYSYLSMLNLTDSHNVGRKRGGVEKALGMVKANTVCIGIDSDGLFPVEEQKFMAEHIPGARYREITSAFGHDGFLLEWKQIKEIIEIEGLI